MIVSCLLTYCCINGGGYTVLLYVIVRSWHWCPQWNTHTSLRNTVEVWHEWFINVLVVSVKLCVCLMRKHYSIMLLNYYQSFPRWNSRCILCIPWFKFIQNNLHTLYNSGQYLHCLHNILHRRNSRISRNIMLLRINQMEGTCFIAVVLTLCAC